MAETIDEYEERIKSQQKATGKLQLKYEKRPSEELKGKLDRERETLRQLTNAAKGNPMERARQSAETAKIFALNRAIQQPPKE